MTELYKKVEEFVEQEAASRLPHLERTVDYVQELDPNADEAMLIAAISHDIYRPSGSGKSFLDAELIKEHQEGSAKMVVDFLIGQNADESLIKKVETLISSHEMGGDKDQNLLKDADSISFLEVNGERFATLKAREEGKDRVKEKLDYMYERITSEKARQTAKPMYEEALKKLETA